ncbi:MAG: tetratricopeptide repeat protein, partial [Dolichospermum sp.]
MLNKLPEAIAQFNLAVKQDQKFWPAINNIGLIKHQQGDIAGAIQQWQTAVKIDKKAAEPLLALAIATYNKGEIQQGLKMGVSALRIDSRYADLDFLKENLWGERLLLEAKKFLELPEVKSALQELREAPMP